MGKGAAGPGLEPGLTDPESDVDYSSFEALIELFFVWLQVVLALYDQGLLRPKRCLAITVLQASLTTQESSLGKVGWVS